jgi:excisionase family DNA binding protein
MKQVSNSSPPLHWLSLSQAARILGIHPTTLRRWSDEGAIRCLRTPGGHRRFLRRDLDAFLEAQIEDSFPEPPDVLTQSIVRQTRRAMETRQFSNTSWHVAFNESERAARRESGRRLLGLAIQFTSRTGGRQRILDEAQTIGREYGRDAAERGLSLVDTTQALMFFREALISAARPGLSTRGNYDAEDVRIHRSLRQFLNQIFFAAMAGFEEHAQSRLSEQAE